MQIQDPDFAPVPNYSQSTVSNAAWVNITLIRTDADGSRSQVLIIAAKR
jgi:hypothetical protein